MRAVGGAWELIPGIVPSGFKAFDFQSAPGARLSGVRAFYNCSWSAPKTLSKRLSEATIKELRAN